MFDTKGSYKDFMLGVLIGGSLGALLFKTKQGKKVQKDILEKYHELSGAAHDYLNEYKKKKPVKKARRKNVHERRKK